MKKKNKINHKIQERLVHHLWRKDSHANGKKNALWLKLLVKKKQEINRTKETKFDHKKEEKARHTKVMTFHIKTKKKLNNK